MKIKIKWIAENSPLFHFVFLTFFFPQPRDELFRRNGADFLLLGSYGVKEIRQTGEESLLGSLVLRLVLQNLFSEGLAEVEGLKD